MRVFWILLLNLGLLTGAVADARSVDRLTEDLEAIRDRHGIPGLAVVTVDAAGVRDAIALGHADLTTRRPMSIDTLVRIGSITKTFNGIAALRLVAAGQLSLDTPLKKLAPELPLHNPWRDEHPVRLVHLLEHTAGLMDLSREEFAHNKPFASLRAAFDFAPERRRVHWPPGRHPEYTNVGAGYLGYVIERVTGMPYATYMRDHVLSPLGLPGATLANDERTRHLLAVGYDSDGVSVIPYWHMTFPSMGAINASPREMAHLPQLLLRRGESNGKPFLSTQAINRMETPHSTLAARAGVHFGYGLGLDQEVYKRRIWYGHMGDGDGYLSHFGYQKELGVGYFVTLNAFKWKALSDLKRLVRRHLAKGVSDIVEPAEPASSPAPQGILGEYEQLTARFDHRRRGRLRVEQRDTALRLTFRGGRQIEILPFGEGRYRRRADPVASIAIIEVDGRAVIMGGFGNYGKR